MQMMNQYNVKDNKSVIEHIYQRTNKLDVIHLDHFKCQMDILL